MIATGQKFSSAPSTFITMTSRSRSQTYNLNVKVFVKVFKTSLNPNLITDLIYLLYDDTYWSKFLCGTKCAISGELSCLATGLVLSLLN